MSEYYSKWVKCPYYVESNHPYQLKQNQIRCEGVADHTTINLVFRSKSEEHRYREQACYSIEGCKRCRIHKMLDEKWGVNDDAEKK